MLSAKQTNEKAIAGRTSGLIQLNETVTWRGKHFGFYIHHQSAISQFNYPYSFTDEMVQGKFIHFKHLHIFKEVTNGTLMTDIVEYDVPYGPIGRIFDYFLLKKHLTRFLKKRNQSLKFYLETNCKVEIKTTT
ncbi:SRPBCC family protein [Aquimarina spongiae]|nr:SRPBCC family protein [Aquimarina spongiae]